MSRILGVDPDLHNTGVALLVDGEPQDVWVVSVDRKLRGAEAASEMCVKLFCHLDVITMIDEMVVEFPRIYPRSKVRPMDLVHLAAVAGAALACRPGRPVYPAQWKGTVPKKIHQTRICSRVGWSYRTAGSHVVPQDTGFEISNTNWSHALDAVGLAHWGGQQPWAQ